MTQSESMEGKRVLVTGAGTGIGKEIAVEFCRRGANVVFHYSHSKAGAEAAVEQAVTLERGKAAAMAADFRQHDSTAALARQALEWLGGIDVLVNNAGITMNRPFEQVNNEQFVILMYETVDPIDDASPPGTYTENDILSVTPVALSQHSLDVQWQLDGVDILGATQTTLDLGTLALSTGTYTVSVIVVDNTGLVRDEAERAAFLQTRCTQRSGDPALYGDQDESGRQVAGPL